MAKARYVTLCIALLMVMLLGSSAWAASISGIVTNYTGKSGRIYLTVNGSNNSGTSLGTSISSAGAFTVNGVQPGWQYSVRAFVDTQGNGIQHANDPTGMSATVTAGTGNVSVGTFALTTPASVPAQAPQVVVYPGEGGNFVMWDGPQDNNGLPIADKYTVSWSTSPTGSPVAGSKDVLPSDKDFFAHIGVSSTLYYQVTAVGGGSTASSGWIQGSAAAGTGSVTGKVYFPGVTVTGPLFVALAQNSANGPPKIHVVAVANPVSGASFTANNVPAGTYEVYPFLDLNNSGTYDVGDVGMLDSNDFSTTVTVSTSRVTAADITIVGANTSTSLSTGHWMSQWGENYNLELNVQSVKKHVVKVQLGSGAQISSPLDLAMDRDKFQAWLNVTTRPTVGDTYQVTLTYSDDTTETVPVAVSAVLDGFATPLAPVGAIPFNPTPTFSWTQPSQAPAEYIYDIWLNGGDSNSVTTWDAWGLPASQTSILYGSQGDVSQPELTDGVNYSWTITVIDRNGNQAANQVSFTPTSSPAISDFSPAGGLAGTSVTITGLNFDPTASYTVLFGGATATVSAATSTSLTVTVPTGASTGRIQVNTGGKTLQSAKDFIVGSPATIRGVIKTTADLAIAGARVEKIDDPTIYTTTAADGSYTLGQLFQNQNVSLKISKSGYFPTYTASYFLQGDLDLRPYPYHLYTQAELTGWGVIAGKGVIVGQVADQNTTPYSTVGGVVVTAQSQQNYGIYYPVTYYNGASLGGTSTYGNGIFSVLNVNDNDWVYVNAANSSWQFFGQSFQTHANSVTEVGILGYALQPWITSLAPTSGKAGTSVIISGSNFNSFTAANTVKFNDVAATVTAATPTSLTVTVPAGATTGPVSLTTAGGTTNYGSFTMHNTLSASVSGSGGALGTVTSVPAGISCRTTGCTGEFDQGTQVQLVATADGGSVLSAWGGACTGNGPCLISMNADKSVSATFAQLQYIKNGTSYYSLLQNAFDGAVSGNTIQAQAQLFTDTGLLFNRPATQVKFKGGYDSSFLTNGGFTTLDGRLDIQTGTLRVEKLKIK